MTQKYKIFILSLIFLRSYSLDNLDQNIQTWAQSILETFNIVNSKSYYPIAFDEALTKALDTFVHKDNHSRFLGPKDYKELIKNTRGEFYGIGIVLGPKQPEDEFLVILDTICNGPAQKHGIQRYDKIIAIDNKPVSNLTIDEAVKMLKGEKRYSTVTLTILRNAKTVLTFTLERDTVKEEHLSCYYFADQNISYLCLSMFSEKIFEQLANLIKKIKVNKPRGLIIDLRDNPGGILNTAVDCASLFLGKNKLVVSTKDKNQKIQEQLYTTKDKIIETNLPIILLVNNFTASAAEILAGALRAYASNNNKNNNPYIFLLGTTTYGKGSVQEVIPISNNCAIKITTCLYYLPNNTLIDCIGIEPDFLVEQKYPPTTETKLLNKIYGKERSSNSDKKNITEPGYPGSSESKNKDYYSQKIDFIKNDYQIQMAATLISMLDLALSKMPNLINTHSKALNFLKNNFITSGQINIKQIT